MMNRAQYDRHLFEQKLPAIMEIFRQTYRQKPSKIKNLFSIETSDREIEQFTGFTGLSLLREIGEGGEPDIDSVLQKGALTFRHKTYALGIEWTKELFDDEKVRLIRQSTEELAFSARETQEIQGASIFNLAFSANGADGVPMCSASHPLWKAGGTQSNILSVAADLTVASLTQATTDYRGLKRDNGHFQALPTPTLLVSASEHYNAHEILKGQWKSDTANNTINAFQYGETGPISDIISWDYLTDPDAWFLVAPPSSTGLIWIWREKPNNYPFMDQRTLRKGIAVRYRMSVGDSDSGRGVYGTPGA